MGHKWLKSNHRKHDRLKILDYQWILKKGGNLVITEGRLLSKDWECQIKIVTKLSFIFIFTF